MADPVTVLTAGAIADLAFRKFIESGAGKLAEKVTEAAMKQTDELRRKIWARLKGKPEMQQIEQATRQTRHLTPEQMQQIAACLQTEMDNDRQFAAEVKQLTIAIHQEQTDDHSSMTQNNYGGTNYQTKTGANNTNFFGGTHQHDRP